MQLYTPTEPETAAAVSLLTARLPADADRIARGVDLIPLLRYETVADRNAYWLAQGLAIQAGSADPGFFIPASPDERRNAGEAVTPRVYHCGGDHCPCWDHTITGQHCRHIYAVLGYRLIIHAKLDALAQAGAVDLRPAGRYDNCYDLADCWGRTIASVIYSPRVDRWRCEEDQDVAAFANWLTREEAQAEIVRPRARGEYDHV